MSTEGVPSIAVVTDWHTNSFCVEVGPFGASSTDVGVVPLFAERVGGWDEWVGVLHTLTVSVENVSMIARETKSIG